MRLPDPIPPSPIHPMLLSLSAIVINEINVGPLRAGFSRVKSSKNIFDVSTCEGDVSFDREFGECSWWHTTQQLFVDVEMLGKEITTFHRSHELER